ncbi:hypothetical protein DENSPDRAFT_839793 [Dentipellis sp. KUC8613]|nr:hypothetical protein DENSPDRAFT_839793 [Dentipellis sp. KUC8613]
MKFLAVALASLVAAVSAQTVSIGSPADGSSITPGDNITVQVLRPDSLTGSQEVALVISVVGCPENGCLGPSEVLGTTLYQGGFNPQFPPPGSRTPQDAPQQNFTVALPTNLQSGGKAQLSVVHLALVGAGPYPMFELKNVTLNIN